MAFPEPPGDPKAWAKRILEQHAANPRSVSAIRLRFAREALGIKPKEQDHANPVD